MYKVKFDNGTVVSFENEPTQQDIDDASQHLQKNVAPAPVAEQPKGFFGQVGDRIKKVVTDTKENYQGIAQTYDKQRAAGNNMALPSRALSTIAGAPRAVTDLAVEGIKQVSPQGFKDDMKSWLQTIVNNPNVKKDVVEPITNWVQQNPATARAGQDFADIVSVLPLGKAAEVGVQTAIKTGGKTISKIIEGGGKAVEVLAKSPEAIVAAKAVNAAKIDKLVNVVTRGTKNSLDAARNTLLSVDTKGVKTFSDLVPKIQSSVDGVLGKVDDILLKNPTIYTLPELKVSTYNYVNRALKNLEELYAKVVDPEAAALIKQFSDKIKTTGINSKELNDFARLYGTEIGQKGFSKATGEALTSASGQMVENIRSGLKKTVRAINAGDSKVLTELDKTASEFIKTKDLFNKIADKVTAKEAATIVPNKLMQIGGKIGTGAVNVSNVVSGGALQGIMHALLSSSKSIGKTMNVLDVQKLLRKTLIQINKINSKSGGNVFNKMIDSQR